MKQIYMDNGATSFPKAPGVIESMTYYLQSVGASVNRSAYTSAYASENIVYETRELLCQIFDFDNPENMVLTKNVTESLNVLIKGLLKPGDHVLVSSMEHNAVMRPLNGLNNHKITYTKVPCDSHGGLLVDTIDSLIQKNTKAIIMTHASNVSGTILPLEKVGRICQENELLFIIDAAQTAGFMPVSFKKLHADAIAFTGHKSLLGPQGTGGFMITTPLAEMTSSLMEGGTGSLSYEEIQPRYMPDKFEAGTPNIPGIYGLHAALSYLIKEDIKTIYEKEMALTSEFIMGLMNISKIAVIGIPETKDRTGVISIDFRNRDNGEAAHLLAKNFGILTRSGLHCAPSAHQTLGTYPHGTVRFGLSHFMTKHDIHDALYAIHHISTSGGSNGI